VTSAWMCCISNLTKPSQHRTEAADPGAGPVCVAKASGTLPPVPRVLQENGRYFLAEDFPESVGKLACLLWQCRNHDQSLQLHSESGTGAEEGQPTGVLNANYIRERLKDVLHLPYDQASMHEWRLFRQESGGAQGDDLDMVQTADGIMVFIRQPSISHWSSTGHHDRTDGNRIQGRHRSFIEAFQERL